MASRTLIEIAAEVCDRCTVNSPATLFGNNDTTARRLRVAAKDTLRDLMRVSSRSGVSQFHSQWVFATRPGVYAYQMPPDYLKMIPGTEQRNRWPLGILGPVGPQAWSNWIAGLGNVAVPMGWRIKNDLIHFNPPPSQAELIVIEYCSRFLVVRDALDADLAPVGGYLQPISPLLPRDGYLSSDAYEVAETSGSSEWGTATWGTAVWGTTPETELSRIPAGGPNSTRFPAYQVRAENFEDDSDRCALSDDYLLSLGMTWRLEKALRKPYADSQSEYVRERDVFLATDAGGARIIRFGEGSHLNEVEPLGDGNWSVG